MLLGITAIANALLTPSPSLLLPLDGLDAATTTTDESSYNHPITFNGNAQLDTAQFKNGTSSLLLDGTGDFLTIPDDPAFSLGAGEWTFECHVRFNVAPSSHNMAFITKWDEAGNNREWWFGWQPNNLTAFYSENGITAFAMVTEGWTPVADQWYHVAFCRENLATNAVRVFVDGVQLGSDDTTINGVTFSDEPNDVYIGEHEDAGGQEMNGWMDNVTITKGICKYTANFTPPA